MLQQTRVETVLAYYDRFLNRFPTVHALAKAKLHDVLKSWEGLGYYRRVLHLHRAAKVVAEGGGEIPRTVEGLRELPGVGVYTAAAIASIAFGRPEAAVDGNVERVISRLVRLPTSPKKPPGKREIDRIARTLLCKKRPGDFNQAWMDLGSLICTPRNPRCDQCPLLSCCAAGREEDAESFPIRHATERAKVPTVRLVVGVLECSGKLLVRRRAEGGLWSGLWEFPTVEVSNGEPASTSLRELAADARVEWMPRPRHLGVVRHELTHRSIRFDVWSAKAESVGDPPAEHRWVTPAAFSRLPVSTAHRRIHDLVTTRAKR